MICIYKVTSPSNKIYIGITNDLKHRKCRHKLNSKIPECHFSFAIAKYGFDNMIWEVIDLAKNYETAHELERRYILHFDSYNNGYNSTLGGEGNSHNRGPLIWTKEVIKVSALKYFRRLDWHKNEAVAYGSAKKFGKEFFEECCSHMAPVQKAWNEETALEEARKHKSVNEWKLASNGSQKYAIKVGLEFYNKCKEHMKLRKSVTKK